MGEWTATDKDGVKLGASTVKKSESGFLITESFSSGRFSGSNFFYLDPSDRRWKLTWVSSCGEICRACGAFQDKTLKFEGEHINPSDGKSSPFRGSLTALGDGRVRLVQEIASDGKNWRVFHESWLSPAAAKLAK